MTSRAEKKHLARLERRHKTVSRVDSEEIKMGITYMFANLIAVAVFPFWLMWVQFKEWKEKK